MVDLFGAVTQSVLALLGVLAGAGLLGRALIRERDRRRDERVNATETR